MKSPKPIVAGALVAGGLLFTSAAAALTLPEEASETAKEQVKALIAGESDDAKRAAQDGRQDDTEASTTDTDEVEEAKVEAADGDDAEGGERPETHGSEVSALATSDETKELDGRERGEVISELARTNGGGDTEDAESETADEDDDAKSAGAAGRERAAKARQGK